MCQLWKPSVDQRLCLIPVSEVYIYTQYIYMETVCLKLEPFFCWLAYGCVMACLEMGAPKTFSPFKLPFAKACMTNAHDFTLLRSVLNGWGLNVFDPSPCWTMWVRKWRIPTNVALQYLFIEKMWSKHWMVRYPFAKPTKGKTELQLQRARRQAPCHMDQRAHGAIHPFDVGGGSKVCPQWPKPFFFPPLWGMVTDPIYSFQALYQTSYTGCWYSWYIIQQCKIEVHPLNHHKWLVLVSSKHGCFIIVSPTLISYLQWPPLRQSLEIIRSSSKPGNFIMDFEDFCVIARVIQTTSGVLT